jgi:hypothetical protein
MQASGPDKIMRAEAIRDDEKYPITLILNYPKSDSEAVESLRVVFPAACGVSW